MTVSGMHQLLRCGVFAVLMLSATSAVMATEKLKLYTSPDYMDPDVVREFEQHYNASVEFSYFDSDDARDEEIAVTNGQGFDLITLNRMQISNYVSRGWLQALSVDDIPNWRYTDKHWSDSLGSVSDHAVPLYWGTLGIGYRQDYLPEGLSRWSELLQPDKSLHNRLSMPAFTRELVAIAMKVDGLPINTPDEKLIKKAGKKLLEQKPFVHGYGYPLLNEQADIVTGKVWAGAFYNGDVLNLQALNKNIHFILPEEGGILWIDYLGVAQSSNKKSLAFAFINFINEAENAARLSRFVSLASPNAAARELLPKELLTNPTMSC